MAEAAVERPESSPGAEIASFKIRAQAGLVDEIILGVIGTVLAMEVARRLARPDPSLVVIGALVVSILLARVTFRAAFVATSGQTPGKRLMGIIVHGPDAQIPSAGRAIARATATELLIVLRSFIIGWGDPFLIHFRDDCRAGHDLVADTRVVHVPEVRKQPSWLVIALLVIPWALASTVGPPLVIIRANSDSMRPTVRMGDRLLVTQLGIMGEEPSEALGQLIVFLPPDIEPTDKLSVKRIVATGGDAVRVAEGKLIRNGQAVEEPYILEPMNYTWPPPEGRLHESLEVTEDGAVVVPEGHYFVLGDNRNDSNDSHRWGEMVEDVWISHPFLPADHLRGRVLAIIWPADRATVVD